MESYNVFDRKLFKERAKGVIRRNYWVCFLASVVCTIVTNMTSSGSSRVDFNVANTVNNVTNSFVSIPIFGRVTSLNAFFGLAIPVMLIGIVISFLINIFITNMFNVGQAKFYLDAKSGNYAFSNIVYAYQSGNLVNLVKTMLLKDVYVFLSFLLLIIPGIIKSYAYYFVPYILADNPHIDSNDALRLSEELTSGIKMELFILDISFFFWQLLNIVTLGLFSYVLEPYIQATKAEAYVAFAKSSEYYDTDLEY